MKIEIINAQVYFDHEEEIEEGWQEVKLNFGKYEKIIQFETEEQGEIFNINFNSSDDEKIAKEIGFVITNDFKNKFYYLWNKYSNEHFR